MAQEIIPVVDHVVSTANAQQRQFLRPRVRHVACRGQTLLETNEPAEGGPLRLPPKCKIDRKHGRNKELQERTSCNHNKLAKEPEQKVPAFVNRNQHKIEHQQQPASLRKIVEEPRIEQEPCDESRFRYGIPIVLERFQERHPLRQ